MSHTSFDIAPDQEIVTTRVINAPIAAVFAAWTNPDLLKQWWGPKGFTNTFHEFELRPGGRWKFTMHGPDKGHYENECIFKTIDPPNLIAWDRLSKPIFRVVAKFEETTEGQTHLSFHMQFATREECDKLRPYVVDKNEENFDRLEAVLQQAGTQQQS